MASSTPTTAAANWYPDPTDPSYERYWDGSTWADFVRPAHRPAAKSRIEAVEPPEHAGTDNAFSTAAMVLGALAVLILPLILGPMGLISGIIGKIKGEPNATPAIVTVVIATPVGLMLGALIDIGVV